MRSPPTETPIVLSIYSLLLSLAQNRKIFQKKNKKNKNIFIFQPSNLVSRRHFLLILTLERILEYKSKEQFLTDLKTLLFDEFGYTENHIFHNEEMEHFEVGIYGEIDGKNRFFWSTHFVF